jgi:hypothetical protein
LVSDPAAEQQVRNLLGTLASVSDSLSRVSGDISKFSQGLNAPGGLGHTLTRDTAVVADVKRVVANLDTSSATLSEDLRALQRNWFFRRYFREKGRDGDPRGPHLCMLFEQPLSGQDTAKICVGHDVAV